jgi:aminoglycoside phosphotransferase (APT) family kinase protein
MGADDTVCTACSWSYERQDACRYHSHIKLFYGVSDRAVWSVGTKLVIKERSSAPPNFEARNLRFLETRTTLPIPKIVQEWTEGDRHFMVNKRLPGEPLSVAWSQMSALEKDRVAKQTADYLCQLRNINSSRIESISGEPVYSAFLFPVGYGVPHGPLSTDDELWDELTKALRGVPEEVIQRLRDRMPTSTPYTFTHGDLASVNIMVENGNLTGIIDWEASGYFPVWWEFACAGIGLGEEDKEWKTLLQSYMPDFAEAWEFWLDFYSLSKYPDLNERAIKLLAPEDSG